MVTIRLQGDTGNTVTTTQGGDTVYVNDVGDAEVTVSQGGKTVTAQLDPGQIFARYDPVNGSVGFGSAVGPWYPVVLTCEQQSAGCNRATLVASTARGFSAGQILSALVDIDGGDSPYYSTAVPGLQTDLRGATLLTGYAIACAAYNYTSTSCPSTLPGPITTDKGKLYFLGQDYAGKGVFTAILGPEQDD